MKTLAFALHYIFTAAIQQNVSKIMNNLKISTGDILLNLVSHKSVTWTFIKLSASYKYVKLFV